MVLSAYVDDFKMAGPVDNMKKAWSITRGVLSMDEPANLGKYLGCGHEELRPVSSDVMKVQSGTFRSCHHSLALRMRVREANPSVQKRRRRLRAQTWLLFRGVASHGCDAK